MAKPFQFTEALVKVLPVPDSDRIYHKDSHFPGLQLCITATGTRTYYYVRRMDGKPTRIRLGTTKQLPLKQARSAAATIAGEVATGKDPQAERRTRRTAPTLDYVWNQWLEAHAKPRKRSWREDVRMWDKCLTTFHGRRLASIRPVEVAQWHTQLGETSGKYLANRAKSLLNTLFTYAIGLELVVVSPCRSVPNFPEQSRERFLLPAEMKAFFDALGAVGEPWHDVFQIALFTGARYGNVAAMQWAEVDFDRMTWTIPPGKMKKGRPVVLALPPPAVAILRSRQDLCVGSPWVFPSIHTDSHIVSPWRAWDRIREASGLTDLRIHDLRRSLGSWQAVAGASLAVIGKSLGHASLRSTQVYSRLTLEPVRESVNRAVEAMQAAATKEGAYDGTQEQ